MNRKTRDRVLIVAPSGGAFGGVEIFSIRIAQELFDSGLFETRVVFRLMKGWRPDPRFTESLARLPFPSTLRKGVSPAILREIAWADLVNCHFPLMDVTFPARAFGKKLALTVENRRIPRHHFLHRLGLRLAHQRWYISRFVARTWEGNQIRRGSSVVPAVSNLPPLSVDPERRKGFLFVARWVPQKGLQELISAYTEAEIDHAAHPLTLVGDGPLRPMVTRAISQSHRRQFIFDRGFVSTAEKHDLLAHARWNVAPATFEEDLGLTPIEARACGVPSIVSDIGGLPEAAGPSGLLCQVGDADALRRSLESAARMPHEEYAARSAVAKKSLKAYLPPEGFYVETFSKLLGRPVPNSSAPSCVNPTAPRLQSARGNGKVFG
jgi:glycosyltransferase involved in cell wall biosynthesis